MDVKHNITIKLTYILQARAFSTSIPSENMMTTSHADYALESD